MTSERQRVLKMVEEGRITAEEGARLIDALDAAEGSTAKSGRGPQRQQTASPGRLVRIRVLDAATGGEKMNFAIPLALARLAGVMIPEAQRLEMERHGIRFNDLINAVESGQTGTMADIRDNDRGERVEMTIE